MRQTLATGKPPKVPMVRMKIRRATMNAIPKAVRQRAAPFQWRLSVEERDEGGEGAVADSAEREAHAVWSDAAENAAERKMFAGSDGNGRLDRCPDVCDGADDDGENRDGGQAPVGFHDNAERCAESERAVGADAVVGDDLGGVFRAGAGDSPECCAGGAEALADAEDEAAGNEDGEAEPCRIAMESAAAPSSRMPLSVQAPMPQRTEIFAPL